MVIKVKDWANSVRVEQQQSSAKQQDLIDEVLKVSLPHADRDIGGTGAGSCEKLESLSARTKKLALALDVMEYVASWANLNRAYSR